MSTAHKFAPRHVYRLFGAVSEPQRPTKEPVWCVNHPDRKALRKANDFGYCMDEGCRKEAGMESSKR